VYGTDIYESTEEKQEQSMGAEAYVDEEEVNVNDIQRKVLKEDIWREIILTSVGRDKAFVSILMRMALLILTHGCKRN
jgi:hypothetical protein